jgi:hypothetical protein
VAQEGAWRGARLGRVWWRIGHGGEVEQVGGRRIASVAGKRCIAIVAGGCIVTAAPQADDTIKVVAVASGENIQG